MELEEAIKRESTDFFHTYKRLGILIDRGEGCYLITDKGERILDMFGGLAVNILGYNHPAINKAIEEQIKKYIHISNYFYQEKQVELASSLLEMTEMKKVFFCNSGTEAVESAIKLTRKYFKGSSKKAFISFSNAFHGRTMGALSLTAKSKYKDDFGPLLSDVATIPFNSVDALRDTINDSTAAVFLECIQGEGGVNVVTNEFINDLIALRNKYEFLIITDEIQSGVGRTGKFCAYENFGLIPDLTVLAKGIGGGLPLGALLGDERVENVFGYGDHGSTFGGNPVAAASGIAVIDELKNGLMVNAVTQCNYLKPELLKLKTEFPGLINDIRGMGLMLGVELSFEGSKIVEKMIEQGVFVNCTNTNVIRLLPPLILSDNDSKLFISKFRKVLSGL
jgi:acetylornithine/N-succinyldiaminopimelate aminotransferase